MDNFILLYERWNGLFPLVFGIYFSLIAFEVLPRNPKDPERLELWRRKFGGMMKVLSPLLIIMGVLLLILNIKK